MGFSVEDYLVAMLIGCFLVSAIVAVVGLAISRKLKKGK
jgi:Tfp pilus assembly protein PilW